MTKVEEEAQCGFGKVTSRGGVFSQSSEVEMWTKGMNCTVFGHIASTGTPMQINLKKVQKVP